MAKKSSKKRKALPRDLVGAIRRELRSAIRSTVRKAWRELAVEEIYGFSLAISGDGGGVAGAAVGTREGLQRAVDQYLKRGWHVRKGDARAALADMLRWNCDDGWRFCFDGFEAASELLDELVHGVDDDVDVADMYPTRLAYLLLQSALAEADHEGLFGRGKQRARVMLNLYAGDQGNDELLSWATPINPSVTRLRSELRRSDRACARVVTESPRSPA